MPIHNKIVNRPITHHAKERTLERTDYTIPQLREKSKMAYKYGYHVRKFSGEFYEYLCSKQIRGAKYVVRVYEDYIYIFDAKLKRMLTIYPVPPEFLPVEEHFNKEESPCLICVRFKEDNHTEYVCEGNQVLTSDIALATEFRTRQKATNFMKNNQHISQLIVQGNEVYILDL